MKEVEKLYKDELKVAEERQIEKKFKLVAQLRPMPGHKCFQLNVRSGEITLAKFKEIKPEFNPNTKVTTWRKTLIQEPDCLYVTALNKKNAIKHLY